MRFIPAPISEQPKQAVVVVVLFKSILLLLVTLTYCCIQEV